MQGRFSGLVQKLVLIFRHLGNHIQLNGKAFVKFIFKVSLINWVGAGEMIQHLLLLQITQVQFPELSW